MIQKDIQTIMSFVENKLNLLKNYQNDDNQIQFLAIRKKNLTLTEFKLYQRRSSEIVLPTGVKKDTLYYQSYQVIDHSSQTRFYSQKIEESKKSLEKTNQKPQQKSIQYSTVSKEFCFSYDHYTYLYSKSKPYLYYDIVYYLTLMKFSNIDYELD